MLQPVRAGVGVETVVQLQTQRSQLLAAFTQSYVAQLVCQAMLGAEMEPIAVDRYKHDPVSNKLAWNASPLLCTKIQNLPGPTARVDAAPIRMTEEHRLQEFMENVSPWIAEGAKLLLQI